MEQGNLNSLTRNDKILSRCEIISYSVGHLIKDMINVLWYGYLLIFLKEQKNVTTQNGALIMLIGQISYAVATPIIGARCDASNGWLCLGKRKLFYVVGLSAQIFAISTVFLLDPLRWFVDMETLHTYPAIYTTYYCVITIVLQVGRTSIYVSHSVLVVELTNDRNEQVQMNSLKYAMTVLSSLLLLLVLPLSTQIPWGGESNISSQEFRSADWKFFSGSSLFLGLLTSVWFLSGTTEPRPESNITVLTPEKVLIVSKQPEGTITEGTITAVTPEKNLMDSKEPEEKSEIDLNPDTPGVDFRKWFSNYGYYIVLLNYTCVVANTTITQVFIPFYTIEYLKMDPEASALVLIIIMVSSLLVSLIIKPLNRKIGPRKTLVIGFFAGIASFVTYFFINPNTAQCVYIAAVFYGCMDSVNMICAVQLQADLIKDDPSSGAFVHGSQSASANLFLGVVIKVLTEMNTNSRYAESVVPGALLIFGFVLSTCMLPKKLYGVEDSQPNEPKSPRSLKPLKLTCNQSLWSIQQDIYYNPGNIVSAVNGILSPREKRRHTTGNISDVDLKPNKLGSLPYRTSPI